MATMKSLLFTLLATSSVLAATFSNSDTPRMTTVLVSLPSGTPSDIIGFLAMGCYVKDPATPALTVLSSKTDGGDNDRYMSIGMCTTRCLERQFAFSGIKNGTECWCGDQLDGVYATDQKAECDMNCPGFNRDFCGGKEAMSLFMAKGRDYTGPYIPESRGEIGGAISATGSFSRSVAQTASGTVVSSIATGGAVRNYGFFGW